MASAWVTTIPHLFKSEIVKKDGSFWFNARRWSYWLRCLASHVRPGPLPCWLMSQSQQHSWSPWVLSLGKVSKGSKSLNRQALDSKELSALSCTFTDDDFCLLSAASAAKISAEGVKCSSSYYRSSPLDLVNQDRFYFGSSGRRPGNVVEKKTKRPIFGPTGSL